jgi:hypothetical protein
MASFSFTGSPHADSLPFTFNAPPDSPAFLNEDPLDDDSEDAMDVDNDKGQDIEEASYANSTPPSSSSGSDEELEQVEEDEEEEEGYCIHLPPHFSSPQYADWVNARPPNILFQVRIGSMMGRIYYRDHPSYEKFVAALLEKFFGLRMEYICGFVIRVRSKRLVLEVGSDEESWDKVLERCRDFTADEPLNGISTSVRATLRVVRGRKIYGFREKEWKEKVIDSNHDI